MIQIHLLFSSHKRSGFDVRCGLGIPEGKKWAMCERKESIRREKRGLWLGACPGIFTERV